MPGRTGDRRASRRTSVALLGVALVSLGTETASDPVCAPHVERHPEWNSVTFRPHTDAFLDCPVAEESYRRVVVEWLAERASAETPPASIALGRAVRYPWITAHIAESALSDPDWDPVRGASRSRRENSLVIGLLSAPSFLARLEHPFAPAGGTVAGVSVEKVLIDRLGTVLPGREPADALVPYDAQVWLRLEWRR